MVIVQPGGAGGGGTQYVLPPATADTLGGIKVGENLTIEEDGTLNAQAGGGGEELNASTQGLFINEGDDPVSIGYQTLTPTAGSANKPFGAITYKKGTNTYRSSQNVTIPPADKDGWGVVKVGDGIDVDDDGVISVSSSGGATWTEVSMADVFNGTDIADDDVILLKFTHNHHYVDFDTADVTTVGFASNPLSDTGPDVQIRKMTVQFAENPNVSVNETVITNRARLMLAYMALCEYRAGGYYGLISNDLLGPAQIFPVLTETSFAINIYAYLTPNAQAPSGTSTRRIVIPETASVSSIPCTNVHFYVLRNIE